jgi:hypothetical protein
MGSLNQMRTGRDEEDGVIGTVEIQRRRDGGGADVTMNEGAPLPG